MNRHVVHGFCSKSLYVVPPMCGEDKDTILHENVKAWLKMPSSPNSIFLFSNPSSILLSGLSSKRQSDHNCSNTSRVTHWKLFIMAAEALCNPNMSVYSLTTLPAPPPRFAHEALPTRPIHSQRHLFLRYSQPPGPPFLTFMSEETVLLFQALFLSH